VGEASAAALLPLARVDLDLAAAFVLSAFFGLVLADLLVLVLPVLAAFTVDFFLLFALALLPALVLVLPFDDFVVALAALRSGIGKLSCAWVRPIRNNFVPQTAHSPVTAVRPLVK
jgi:hypothetical protein